MPLLVLLFILIPIAELYVIIQVGSAIGLLPTVAILLADSLLGAALLRWQGRSAWIRFNRALAENRMPAREVFDGVAIVFGGALLLTPGFITDIVGILLLLPPSRAGLRRLGTRLVKGRLALGPRVAVWGFGKARNRRGRSAGAGGGGAHQARDADRFASGGPFGPRDPFEPHEPRRSPGAGEGPRGANPFDPGEAFDPRSPGGGQRPGDIEGTATEIDDDERLGPGIDDQGRQRQSRNGDDPRKRR